MIKDKKIDNTNLKDKDLNKKSLEHLNSLKKEQKDSTAPKTTSDKKVFKSQVESKSFDILKKNSEIKSQPSSSKSKFDSKNQKKNNIHLDSNHKEVSNLNSLNDYNKNYNKDYNKNRELDFNNNYNRKGNWSQKQFSDKNHSSFNKTNKKDSKEYTKNSNNNRNVHPNLNNKKEYNKDNNINKKNNPTNNSANWKDKKENTSHFSNSTKSFDTSFKQDKSLDSNINQDKNLTKENSFTKKNEKAIKTVDQKVKDHKENNKKDNNIKSDSYKDTMFQKPTFSNSSNKESPKHNFIKNTKSTQDKKFDSKKGFSDDFNKISDKGKQLSPNKTFSKEKKNFTKNLNLNYKKSQTKTYNKGIKDSIKNSNLKSNQNHNKEKTNIFSKKVIPTSIHRTDLKDINNLNKSFHKNNVYNKGSTKNFRQKDRKVDKKATLNNVIFIDSKQPKILTKGKFSTSVIKSVNQKKSFNQQKKLSKITSDFKNNSSLNNKKHELTSIDILNKRTQFLDSLRKMNDKIKLKVFSKVMLKSKPKVLRRIRTRLKLKRKLAYFVSGKLKELKTKIFKKTRRKLKSVYNLFLGVLTKKGKKSTAKKILDTSLSNISLKGQIPLSIFFRKCLEKMSIPLEIKQVRRGKQFYTVPFIMRQKRQRFLTIKNLVFNLRQDKTSIPFHSKLSNELANIYLDRHSKVILQNKAVILDALKNKANRHYRW